MIDLESGNQPLANEDGTNHAVVNGEIYDHGVLREALRARWEFASRSDTEVLLAGMLLDGVPFVRELNAQCA